MPISGGKETYKGAIEPISRQSGKSETAKEAESRLRDLIGEEQKLNRQAGKESGPKLNAEVLHRMAQALPRLIQRTLEKVDSSQVYRSFHLPGSDRVVHDRREERGAGAKSEATAASKPENRAESIGKESKMPMEGFLIHKGKLSPETGKTYENFLSDPSTRMRSVNPEQQAAQSRLQKLLTLFEKRLIQRFEEGEQQSKSFQKGEPHFLNKTGKEWRSFFAKFAARTLRKQTPMAEIREAVFRGFVEGKGKAVLISDLTHTGGLVEKFVRLRLADASAQSGRNLFQQMQPGTRVAAEQLHSHLKGDVDYLALRQAEGELPWSRAAEKGKFFDSAAEAIVAGNLGVQLHEQLKEKAGWLKRHGGGKKRGGTDLWGEEGDSGAGGGGEGQFIPWWQHGRNPRKIRWGLAAFAFVIAVGILIALSTLV